MEPTHKIPTSLAAAPQPVDEQAIWGFHAFNRLRDYCHPPLREETQEPTGFLYKAAHQGAFVTVSVVAIASNAVSLITALAAYTLARTCGSAGSIKTFHWIKGSWRQLSTSLKSTANGITCGRFFALQKLQPRVVPSTGELSPKSSHKTTSQPRRSSIPEAPVPRAEITLKQVPDLGGENTNLKILLQKAETETLQAQRYAEQAGFGFSPFWERSNWHLYADNAARCAANVNAILRRAQVIIAQQGQPSPEDSRAIITQIESKASCAAQHAKNADLSAIYVKFEDNYSLETGAQMLARCLSKVQRSLVKAIPHLDTYISSQNFEEMDKQVEQIHAALSIKASPGGIISRAREEYQAMKITNAINSLSTEQLLQVAREFKRRSPFPQPEREGGRAPDPDLKLLNTLIQDLTAAQENASSQPEAVLEQAKKMRDTFFLEDFFSDVAIVINALTKKGYIQELKADKNMLVLQGAWDYGRKVEKNLENLTHACSPIQEMLSLELKRSERQRRQNKKTEPGIETIPLTEDLTSREKAANLRSIIADLERGAAVHIEAVHKLAKTTGFIELSPEEVTKTVDALFHALERKLTAAQKYADSAQKHADSAQELATNAKKVAQEHSLLNTQETKTSPYRDMDWEQRDQYKKQYPEAAKLYMELQQEACQKYREWSTLRTQLEQTRVKVCQDWDELSPIRRTAKKIRNSVNRITKDSDTRDRAEQYAAQIQQLAKRVRQLQKRSSPAATPLLIEDYLT